VRASTSSSYLINPLIFFACRFRWVFCQLDVLRHCLPTSIRQTLKQLPKSLDDTYLRVLGQIPQANQAHAHRMLQCLVVAVRLLSVEALAELLAFEFGAAQGGVPNYRPALRLDDQTQAVLTTCLSLVTIVEERDSGRRRRRRRRRRVVQFSHFFVKEFLRSNRLASSFGDISRYHIHLVSAHTVLTQACLGLFLHLDNRITEESMKPSPLARYAAKHWVEHAQFEDVASRVKDGMETLFDADKPHFEAWVGIYDIDPGVILRDLEEDASPLYYSALCGFYDLVDHLAIKHPHHVNAFGGQYEFPLLAALGQGHVDVAELLLKHGADVDVREATGKTILLVALSWLQDHDDIFNIVEFLLSHGADVKAQDDKFASSLNLAEMHGMQDVAAMLLKHKADVNHQDNDGKTPLHKLLESSVYYGHEDEGSTHVRFLLEHGAEVDRRDKDDETPLHLAIRRGWFKLAGILLKHGADADAGNIIGDNPLHILSERAIDNEDDVLNLVLLLLKHGAAVNSRTKNRHTPLHLTIHRNRFKLAETLLEHGADADAEDIYGWTPLHTLSGTEMVFSISCCYY
jgi:ankyrin repeat protein